MQTLKQLYSTRKLLADSLIELTYVITDASVNEQAVQKVVNDLVKVTDKIHRMLNAIPHEQAAWTKENQYEHHMFPVVGDDDHQPRMRRAGLSREDQEGRQKWIDFAK